jgi:hypothetical protein
LCLIEFFFLRVFFIFFFPEATFGICNKALSEATPRSWNLTEGMGWGAEFHLNILPEPASFPVPQGGAPSQLTRAALMSTLLTARLGGPNPLAHLWESQLTFRLNPKCKYPNWHLISTSRKAHCHGREISQSPTN